MNVAIVIECPSVRSDQALRTILEVEHAKVRDVLARKRIQCHENTPEAIRAPLPNGASVFSSY
jgi:hypothetical protein